ncbi:MAG: hypothetical protein ABEH80_06905 [Halobaculum sp.]
MESEALILFQQTTRGTGTRRFKVYRITEFEPVQRLVGRFQKYLRRNRFPEEVHTPHWLETEGPLMESTLAKVGARFRQFSTLYLFAVTNRQFQPFVAVPLEVDVIPALAKSVRLRLYDADSCDDDGVPRPDAEPTAAVDRDSFEPPLTGAVGEGGPLELFHLFALQSATRLARNPRRGVELGDPDVPTALVSHGDHVLRVDLHSGKPLKRLSSHGLFVNYSEESIPGETHDDRLNAVLQHSAAIRYRYARHMWAVRKRTADGTMADDPDTYREELEAARAHFFMELVDEFGTAIAPFSSGVYGGALRDEADTRADTFSLGGRIDFDHDSVVSTLDDADPNYDPEYDRTRR